jgi:two-component system chemotaxis sensor kinase CheA
VATDRYKYFRIEAAELFDNLTRGVLAFEKDPSATDAIGALLRHAHTLKGAARVVRQLDIANAAHALEDELAKVQSGTSTSGIEPLLRLLDTISEHLAHLDAPPAPAAAQTTDPSRAGPALPKAATHTVAPPPEAPAAQVVRADVAQLESVRESIAESLADLSQLRRDGSSLSNLRELAELIERQSLTRRLSHTHQYETLLGSIHSTISELLGTVKRFERHFSTTLERVNRELQQARIVAEQVQLVSASSVFDGLERAVRDAARELRKDVRFETSGGDLKLDSHVLDVTHRALLHLVRNAVAHGLEGRAQRGTLGKPNVGTVHLSVRRVDQRICFSCADDGQGVDIERLGKALRTAEGDAPRLDSDDAVLQALLHGGVTTATQVNNIAGRGVGMSAVREAARSIGATINLENRPGHGATFEFSVPATLSSILGLWVEVGEDTFVLPLESVRQTQSIEAGALVNSGDKVLLRANNDLIPYVPLHAALERHGVAPARLAVLLEYGEQRLAVGISRVVGCQTQVMHRLPVELPALTLVDGAVFDAGGVPQLVLNVPGLFAARSNVALETPAPKTPLEPILIIDDSLTTRMLEQSILESAGYRVQLATSAEQGLEMAASRNYSLFLVDVEMPGMDGFTFVETTRADVRFKGIPAILVSSRSAPADLARGRSAGASAYIVKGHFDQRELLRHIKALLGE